MSDVCKEWYNDYKKKFKKHIELWNTDQEKCSIEITGRGLKHNAWRMLHISGAVDRMGGWANFSHYVNMCAETDYECFDEKLKAENEKLKEIIDRLPICECHSWADIYEIGQDIKGHHRKCKQNKARD